MYSAQAPYHLGYALRALAGRPLVAETLERHRRPARPALVALRCRSLRVDARRVIIAFMSCSSSTRSMARGLGALAALGVLGCAEPQGIALLRVSELEGPCETAWESGYPVIPSDLEYERIRTAAAFQGGSRWSGGQLIATGWREADGSVARLQIDLGPGRGYQATYMPTHPLRDETSLRIGMEQAISYVVWRDGERIAAARDVAAVIQYAPHRPDDAAGPFGRHDRPGTLFLHAAFEVVDEAGRPECHVVAMHARADAERDELYDPSWFEPNPSALIVEDDTRWIPPTFDGDREPSADLVVASEAAADPGGAAPGMDALGPTLFDHSVGGGNLCD